MGPDTATVPDSRTSAHEPDWAQLIDRVLADPSRLQLLFQPIVSLSAGEVVGYEALSRFEGHPGLTPDRWFAAADELGVGARLEAVVVARCLQLRTSLPPNCFLTVNVSPHLLTEPQLQDMLLDAGDLRPLVLELTEHQAVRDLRPLVDLRERLARQGALLALDDAGSGHSGLQQMTRLRPHIIKLDRALVDGADRDEVKLALAELLGEFGGRIDAWLLAEGIETWEEVDAFQRLKVPLGQGYLLGRPAPPWSRLDPATAQRLRSGSSRARLVEHVASLVEAVHAGDDEAPPTGRIGLRVDSHGSPVALVLPLQRSDDLPDPRHAGELTDPSGHRFETHRLAPVSLRVPRAASVVDVARRVVGRPESCRFDPVVVVDDVGRAVGIVRVESLLMRLTQLKSRP